MKGHTITPADLAEVLTNRFRRTLICWEKKPENHIAFLYFACALIVFHPAGLFGSALNTPLKF
jgi:hypothetical protein